MLAAFRRLRAAILSTCSGSCPPSEALLCICKSAIPKSGSYYRLVFIRISDDFNCRLNGTVEPEDLLVALFHTRLPQPLYGELCLYRFLMFIHLMNFIIPHQGFKTGNVILSTLFAQEMIQIFSKCRDMTVCRRLESKLFLDKSACKLLEKVVRHLGGLLVLQQVINKKEIPVLFLECYFQERGFHAFDSYIGLDTVAIRYDSSISGFELPSSGVLLCNRQGRSEEHTSELQSRGHLVSRPPPPAPRFPYTTLFRSGLLVLQQVINKKEIPVLFLECYFQERGFHAFDSYIGLDTVAIRYDSSISGFELPSSGVLLCNRQGVILCVVQSLNPPAAWNKIFCNGQLQRGVVRERTNGLNQPFTKTGFPQDDGPVQILQRARNDFRGTSAPLVNQNDHGQILKKWHLLCREDAIVTTNPASRFHDGNSRFDKFVYNFNSLIQEPARVISQI